MSRPRRVLGYCRVSSIAQTFGTSLADQQATIRAYAKERGLDVHHVYVEAESGIHEKLERREQMRALQADVRANDLVLCAKLDRWSRDPLFSYSSIGTIKGIGARMFFIDDNIDPSTPEGDSALGMRILFAREEHKRIRERLVGTRQGLRDRGYYTEGTPPFGYRRRQPKGHRSIDKCELLEVPEESAVVRQVYSLAMSGRPLSSIADETGLERSRVHKILRSRHYLGEIQNSVGEWIRGRHPALIDADTFMRVADHLAARRLGGARPRTGAKSKTDGWILRDVAVCTCGARMGSAYGPERVDLARNFYYRCAHRCGTKMVRVDVVEGEFAPMVLERLGELREELGRGPEPTKPRANDAPEKRAKVMARRERYLEAYADGHLTRDALREKMVTLDAELLRLDASEVDKAPRLASAAVRREALRELAAIQTAWRRASAVDRRELVRQLAERVTVHAGLPPKPVWRGAADLLVGGL